jgi:hypothetical protein
MFQSRSAQRSQHRAAGLAGDYYTGTSDKDFAAYLAGMREETTRRALESAYRALDYSQVQGNRPPTTDELRLIRDDIAAREPRDQREADLISRQLAWIDQKLAQAG